MTLPACRYSFNHKQYLRPIKYTINLINDYIENSINCSPSTPHTPYSFINCHYYILFCSFLPQYNWLLNLMGCSDVKTILLTSLLFQKHWNWLNISRHTQFIVTTFNLIEIGSIMSGALILYPVWRHRMVSRHQR